MRARLCAQSYVETYPKALELGEELPRLLAEDDAGEGGILAHDAHAGVSCDKHQEPGLPLGEALLRDRPNGVVEVHPQELLSDARIERPPAFAAGAGRDAEAARPRRPPPPRAAPASADDAHGAAAVTAESGRRLGRCVTAAVVDGLDLEISSVRSRPSRSSYLDARVGKLDVPVLVRQLVLDGPPVDLVR